MISEREQQNRDDALLRALSYKSGNDTADDILKDAEKYLEFLQGNDEET